jgi:hypothetical protein
MVATNGLRKEEAYALGLATLFRRLGPFLSGG